MPEQEPPRATLFDRFAVNKTFFFQDFSLHYFHAFRLHKDGKLLGNGRKMEGWNTSEHCLIAGVMGQILGEELHLPVEDVHDVVEALLLHDWAKRLEVEAIDVARKEGTSVHTALTDTKEHDKRTLLLHGISPRVVELTEANTPKDEHGPQTDVEKVVWYVDAMMSALQPGSIAQRFDDFSRGWTGSKEDESRRKRNIEHSNSYREQYHGKSLIEVQLAIGERLNQEFSARTQYEGDPDYFHQYLLGKFVERIVTYE